ncbi:MAG: hypothetical protein V4702_04990 [Patescibacteria group bacterium]
MNVTISLKQLRTDPREYIRLLNSGYEVSITEHRHELVRVKAKVNPKTPQRGDSKALLEAIRTLPRIKDPAPHVDTPTRLRQIKAERFARKYGS